MKYFILITTFIVLSTQSMISMELESPRKKVYYSHLEHVKAAAEGKPSITIINNDTDEYLCINIDGTQKYGTSYSLGIYQNTQMTLCPYLSPNSLNTRQIQNGTTITLSLFTQRLHCFVPFINGNPAIEIHKGMFCNCIKNKNKIYLIHNVKQMENGLMLTLVDPLKRNIEDCTIDIGSNSTVQFGDTIHVDYDINTNRIHVIHNQTKTISTFPVTNHMLKLSNSKLMRRHTR